MYSQYIKTLDSELLQKLSDFVNGFAQGMVSKIMTFYAENGKRYGINM